MFGGMDAFDEDPYSFADLQNTGEPATPGQAGMGSFTSLFAAGGMPTAVVGAAAEHAKTLQPSGVVPQVQGILESIGSGLQARSEAKMAAQAMKFQALRDKGQLSQQVYEAKLQKLMREKQSGFMSRYGTIVVLGGFILIGGVVVYTLMKRKRRG